MDRKSYSQDDLLAAVNENREVWALDTGNDGEDDILIGSREEVEEMIIHDRMARGLGEKLPEHWTLERLDPDFIRDLDPGERVNKKKKGDRKK